MNTVTMLKSKWYLVEMFTAKKSFRITVRKPLDTKAESLTFENSRVKSHNHKSLSKLIQEGWTDLNHEVKQVVESISENASEIIVETVKVIETKQEFNPEVEEAIRQNYIKKAEKKAVVMYKGASTQNEYSDEVKRFLSPIQQPKTKAFDMSFYSLSKKEQNKILRTRAEQNNQREVTI